MGSRPGHLPRAVAVPLADAPWARGEGRLGRSRLGAGAGRHGGRVAMGRFPGAVPQSEMLRVVRRRLEVRPARARAHAFKRAAFVHARARSLARAHTHMTMAAHSPP
jgi:hypothetical protein